MVLVMIAVCRVSKRQSAVGNCLFPNSGENSSGGSKSLPLTPKA